MSRRPFRHFALFCLALGGATLLFWRWRQSLTRPPAAALPPASLAGESGPALPARDPTAAPGTGSAADTAFAALRRALARGDARAHEVLLSFKDDAALRRWIARAQLAGLSVTGHLPRLNTIRVHFDDPEALRHALLGSGEDPASFGANSLVNVPRLPGREDRPAVNQVPFGDQALAFLGATGDRTAWGRGTTIAILDTGIAADATFGAGRVRTLDVGCGTTPGAGEDDGHGTAVAALAAGAATAAPGVAPGASLLSIRVTDAAATSDLFTLAQGIVAATDAGARLINISLGGYATGAVLDSAINYATQLGVLIIAAAGNDQAAQLAWPAADARVISVGAIDLAEQQVSFSNSGPQLKLSAPGYGVQTAWLDGQRVTVDGTSASAPLVAGAVATILSLNPFLSPQQAVDLLLRTANDAGQPGADPAFGYGILNLATALNRNNPAYVDTAVASQFYDEASREMQFVVQNRSGRTVSGLTLNVSAWGAKSAQPVPSLAAGETFVAKVPVTVREATLNAAGQLSFSSSLVNPPGTVDADPANNQRTTLLRLPGKP